MKEPQVKNENRKSGEIFLPWLIKRKDVIFLVALSIFMLHLLVRQGGATDLNKTYIWMSRGFSILIFLLFYLIEYARITGKGLPLPSKRQPILRWGSLCLVILIIANLFTTRMMEPALAECFNFIMLMVLMWLVSFYTDSKDKIIIMYYIIAVIGLFAAIYGLSKYLLIDSSHPLSSFFEWHNPAGGYFSAILLLFIALFLTQSPSNSAGRFGWIGSIIVLLSLIFTLSRGAWISTIIAFLLLLLLLGIKRSYNRVSVLSASILVVVLIVIILVTGGKSYLEPVYQRIISFTATKDFSLEGRKNYYSGAIEIFKNHPVTGTGLGSFGYVYPAYQSDPRHYAKDPHSFYLRLLAETGIFGVVLILIMLWGYLHLLIKFMRTRDIKAPGILAGLIAALTAGLLHLAIDFDDTFPIILLNLCIIWICGMNLLDSNEPSLEPNQPTGQSNVIRVSIQGSTILITLLIFAGVYYCGRMHYSYSFSQTGTSLMKSENWSEAEKCFDKSLDFDTRNVEALAEHPRALLFLYANSIISEKEKTREADDYFSRAIVAAKKARKYAPFNAKSFFVSGKVNSLSDDPDNIMQSLDDFETALKKDPVNSPEYYFETLRSYWLICDLSDPELKNRFFNLIRDFKNLYPLEKIEEYARTRTDWIDQLPSTWQDILILEAKYYTDHEMKDKAIENLKLAKEIEAIRKKVYDDTPEIMRKEVLGSDFIPRDEYLDGALSALSQQPEK
jgi:O-antigen ligase